jgi:DNA polymerase III subunit delta'
MEFRGVLGHDRQKLMLSSLVEKEKLPHALLFSGPAGVGKRTIAIELIRNLFCEKHDGCGKCRGCLHFAGGIHPDFTLLAGETAIKIDELRAIRKEVYEPPFEAPIRVILIDNAEVMTREAANALLKTLEEPPPSNLFILVTSREQDMPVTVRSRCMRIGFGTLSVDVVASHFQAALGLDRGQAEVLASISSGSIASGLFWRDADNFQMRERIARLLMGKKKGYAAASLVAERIVSRGHEQEYLSFLLAFLRDLWWFGQTEDANGLVNGDLREIIGQAEPMQVGWVEASIAKVQKTVRTLRYNVNRFLAIERLMIDVMRPI